jgi:hypothetical protein
MTKLLEHLKVMNSIDGFPLLQKLNQYASFTTQDSYVAIWTEDIVDNSSFGSVV